MCIRDRYKKGVNLFIKRKWLAFGLVIASVVVLLGLMKITPTGMVPNEDTGTFFVAVSMPPATSLEKTQAAMARIDSLLAATPGLKSRTEIAGYSFMAGEGSAYGTFICKLKPWEERTKEQNVDAIMGMLTMQTRNLIKMCIRDSPDAARTRRTDRRGDRRQRPGDSGRVALRRCV